MLIEIGMPSSTSNSPVKGACGEGPEGNEEHVIGNWRKGDLFCIMPESLAELCPALMWKGELVSNKLEYLAE